MIKSLTLMLTLAGSLLLIPVSPASDRTGDTGDRTRIQGTILVEGIIRDVNLDHGLVWILTRDEENVIVQIVDATHLMRNGNATTLTKVFPGDLVFAAVDNRGLAAKLFVFGR